MHCQGIHHWSKGRSYGQNGRNRDGADKFLADPTKLQPFEDKELLTVVIETPKGSRNKHAFDAKESSGCDSLNFDWLPL
jgi:hypothetical protein